LETKPEGKATCDALISQLNQTSLVAFLPDVMPSFFVHLEETMPGEILGKIDRF
jgi:hypothetical protein